MNKKLPCIVTILSKQNGGTRSSPPNQVYHVSLDLGQDHLFDARIFFETKPSFDQPIAAEAIFLNEEAALEILTQGSEYCLWEAGIAGTIVFSDQA